MTIPKAVAAGLEQAEQMLQALNAPPQVAEAPTPTEAPQEQAQDAAAQATEAQEQDTQEAAAAASASVPRAEYQALEHKYRTLQGMHRHEKFGNEQALQQVQALREEIATLKQSMHQQQAQPLAPLDLSRLSDEFGVEVVAQLEKLVAQAFTREATKLEARVAALEGAISGQAQSVAQTKEQLFFADLGVAVPAWRDINEQEAFHHWLAEVDPVYGVMRQDALEAAHRALDAQRVAAIFKAFEATRAKPQAGAADALHKQVAPPRTAPARSAAPQQAPQPRVITQEEVHTFYSDVAKGAYKGREQEMQRREAEINEALAQGRIR